jgi:hypothetical protein
MSASPPAALPHEALATLQAAVLQAALHGTALPGGATISLPDRQFLPADGSAALVDEHLAPGLPVRLPPGVHVVPVEAPIPDAAFLRFGPPTADDTGTVWLTLEMRLAASGSARGSTALGGVQVGVRRVHGDWQISGAPRAFAT